MISQSLHYSLSCDRCGLGYGEIGNIEDVPGALRGTGWIIIGNKHFCNYCRDKALEEEKEKQENPSLEITDPEVTMSHGGRTEHGWIKCSERMPEAGLQWVYGRTPDGKVGVCRKSRSLGVWVDDRNEEIPEGVEYWNYLPAFP